MKNKLKHFWQEWGITKQEAGYFLAAASIFGMIFIFNILGGLFL